VTNEPISAPVESQSPGWRVRPIWIGVALIAVALPLVVARAGTGKLTLSADVLQAQRSHGTWRHMFDLHGVSATIPLPLWVLALVAAGLIGFPYAWLATRSLPDRGYALSRVIGLLLLTWVVWWISSLRLLPFTRAAIAVAILIVGAGAAAIVVSHRDEFVAWARSNWRLVLIEEGVFWVFFALVLFVRWSNPDLWHATRGGEKPMDFSYLNAVTKSSFFPPYDPWFADGQMNYYYYGFVQVAGLAKITAIPPAIAYNLAIPTLAGLLASTAFCATLGLSSWGRGRLGKPLVLAGLGALFVTALGNLGELRVLRLWLEGTVANDWWFWNATRVITPAPGEPGPITEFPAFTFIYGDLHAHAMALPLAGLALALTVAVVRDAGRLCSVAPCLALLGLTLGALWVTNTWDLPTYGLIALCGIAIASLAVDRSRRGLLVFTSSAVGVMAVAYLAFLPFHLHYESVFQGFQRWQGRQTRFVDYLTVHGLFLFAIVSALVVQLAFSRDLGSIARTYRLALRSWDRYARFRSLRGALVQGTTLHRIGLGAAPVALGLALVCALLGLWPEVLAVLVATLALLAWPTRSAPGVGAREQALRRFVVVLVLLGLALTMAVEFWVARNVDIGRTNTVFKYYLQVWLMWALAAAVSVGVVYERLPRVWRSLREGWRLAFVVLLAFAFLYPVLAARAKIQDRFDTSVGRTLDGTAFMKKAVFSDKAQAMPLSYDRDAIRWIQENVDGSPVVAEVNTAPTLYGWQGRYSWFTGNPTIVGWDFHQRQQRPPQSEQVYARVADVQKAYGTKDPAVAHRILASYGASYVVVGPLERAYYPEGTAKWEEGEGRYWTIAYANPGVRVYRVVPSETASAESSG
jgi:YYY domain-containing protein